MRCSKVPFQRPDPVAWPGTQAMRNGCKTPSASARRNYPSMRPSMTIHTAPSKFFTFLGGATVFLTPILAFLFLGHYATRFGYPPNLQTIGSALIVLTMAWIFFLAMVIELTVG